MKAVGANKEKVGEAEPPPGATAGKGKAKPTPIGAAKPRPSAEVLICVFDFDDTIAAVNLEGSSAAAAVKDIFGGKPRIAALDSLFRDLQTACVKCAICSFNSTDTIRKAMVGANLFQYFDPELIFGREDVMDDDCRDKGATVRDRILAPVLATTSSPPHPPSDTTGGTRSTCGTRSTRSASTCTPPTTPRLLFVDDKLHNCKSVQAIDADGKSVETLHVAVEGGIGEWECSTIRRWALEGTSVTREMLMERRASLAQAECERMRVNMATPPRTIKEWRESFVDDVVGGTTGKITQLVVAIILLSDDEKVSTVHPSTFRFAPLFCVVCLISGVPSF